MSIVVFEAILTLVLVLAFFNSFFKVETNFPLALAAMYVWRLQKVAGLHAGKQDRLRSAAAGQRRRRPALVLLVERPAAAPALRSRLAS